LPEGLLNIGLDGKQILILGGSFINMSISRQFLMTDRQLKN